MALGKRQFCSVKSCFERTEVLFRFPSDVERCRKWVQAVGDADLLYVPVSKLHELRRVCVKHFLPKDVMRGQKYTRLRAGAVPCNFDPPVTPLPDDVMEAFPLRVEREPGVQPAVVEPAVIQPQPVVVQPAVIEAQEDVDMVDVPFSTEHRQEGQLQLPVGMDTRQQEENPGPSTSLLQDLDKYSDLAVPLRDPGNVSLLGPSSRPSTSGPPSRPSTSGPPSRPSTSGPPSRPSTSEPSSRPSTSKDEPGRAPRTTPQQLLQSMGIGPVEITPVKRRLCKELLLSYRKLRYLKRSKKPLTKLSKEANLEQLLQDVVSPSLASFIKADMRNRKRAPTGHRWTLNEKLTALAIFKRSGRAYRYLSAYLSLPSVRTLQRLLQTVPLKPGISSQAIAVLTREAKRMSMDDRQCIVMFDEMFIKASLTYNPATGLVDGLTDLGVGQRSDQVANYALIFMVQGLRRRFKLPVAHYFNRSSIKTPDLCGIIKKVVAAVQSTGLCVAATVCDQGSSNVKALKKLIAETPEIETFFRVNDEKVFVLIDVPHLFKCLRNNFQEAISIEWKMTDKELKRRPEGSSYEYKLARWSHIVKAWQHDRRFFRMSPLTKAHVRPVGMAKMKVKYAVQALSQRTKSLLTVLGLDEESRFHIPGALRTAEVVRDLDYLFDVEMHHDPALPLTVAFPLALPTTVNKPPCLRKQHVRRSAADQCECTLASAD